ncbi:PIPO, partial [Blackberry virus Y]|uniref:PIPO n=1 Tax=Blackberry virus Y TaxID=323118 RepID=UPI0002656657
RTALVRQLRTPLQRTKLIFRVAKNAMWHGISTSINKAKWKMRITRTRQTTIMQRFDLFYKRQICVDALYTGRCTQTKDRSWESERVHDSMCRCGLQSHKSDVTHTIQST